LVGGIWRIGSSGEDDDLPSSQRRLEQFEKAFLQVKEAFLFETFADPQCRNLMRVPALRSLRAKIVDAKGVAGGK